MSLSNRHKEIIRAIMDGRTIMEREAARDRWHELEGSDEHKIHRVLNLNTDYLKIAPTRNELQESIRWVLSPPDRMFNPKDINNQVLKIMDLIKDYLP